jgi:hypothetical protein
VGVPVLHSAALHGRPYVGISITPSFGFGRQRDGRAALGRPLRGGAPGSWRSAWA